jgi:hypothetical protein
MQASVDYQSQASLTAMQVAHSMSTQHSRTVSSVTKGQPNSYKYLSVRTVEAGLQQKGMNGIRLANSRIKAKKMDTLQPSVINGSVVGTNIASAGNIPEQPQEISTNDFDLSLNSKVLDKMYNKVVQNGHQSRTQYPTKTVPAEGFPMKSGIKSDKGIEIDGRVFNAFKQSYRAGWQEQTDGHVAKDHYVYLIGANTPELYKPTLRTSGAHRPNGFCGNDYQKFTDKYYIGFSEHATM